MTTANLANLLLYGIILIGPISGLVNDYGQVKHARGVGQRLIDVFSTSSEPMDNKEKFLLVRGIVIKDSLRPQSTDQ